MNVLIVAMDDPLLRQTTAEYQGQYPDLKVIPVPCNLGEPGYMEKLDEYTNDKDVQLLFCNAGFMMTGFYTLQSP